MLNQIALFKPDKSLPLRRRIELQLAELRDVRGILEGMHYLKRVRMGRQLNYLILIDGVVDGVITYALPMMSADFHDVPSDQVLEFARLFLKSNIQHSASCAIGKSIRRVKRDWVQRFPESPEPKIIVSWSDKTRHKGTIYKAANFKHDGITKSGGGNTKNSKRGFRKKHSDYGHLKDRWIYWL